MTNERLAPQVKKQVLKRLKALYPDAKPELDFSNPYETLVATILSAQNTDKNVNSVTPAVFRDFPTLKSMAETTPEILYPYVKSCGFASKAKNIVMACRKIMEEFDGQIPREMEKLITLPGVGRKTANVVLANAFGVPPSRWIPMFFGSATGWVWQTQKMSRKPNSS